MGIFGKLAFWKHEAPAAGDIAKGRELGLGHDRTGIGRDMTGLPSEPAGLRGIGEYPDLTGMPPGRAPPSYGMPPGGLEPAEEHASAPSAFGELRKTAQGADMQNLSKNIEIISSKMDALKAVLDTLSVKIEKIEKIAEGEQETGKRYSRW